MSESTPLLPESSSGLADEAARKKRLALLGGSAAVIAIAASGYFLFFAGGSSNNTTVAIVPPHQSVQPVAPSPSASATSAVTDSGVKPVLYQRDPFSPFVGAPVAPTSPPAGAPTVAPSATPSATPKPSSTPLPSNVDETLVLTSVNYAANTVSVTVDGKAYQPKNGQVFAQYFKLVSILSNTGATDPMNDGASFEYGDQFIQLTVGQSSHFTS